MNKFKIGDNVKTIYDSGAHLDDYKLGIVSKIIDIDDLDEFRYKIHFENTCYWCKENELELVEELVQTIDDLQFKDIITLKNGDELILTEDNRFKDIKLSNYNNVIHLEDFNKNLTFISNYDNDFDIVKVERPIYSIIYERTDKPKEMTIEEISKALGYEVKIKEEEE